MYQAHKEDFHKICNAVATSGRAESKTHTDLIHVAMISCCRMLLSCGPHAGHMFDCCVHPCAVCIHVL